MRILKETFSLLAVATFGSLAGWWTMELFGVEPTCDLLKWGGSVSGLFFIATRRLNAAFDQGASLADFDAVTREQFDTALVLYRKRFRARLFLGFGLAAYALSVGTLVGKSKIVSPQLTSILILTAGGALATSAIMAGIQLWVSSWPSEYIAGIRRKAAEQIARRQALIGYTQEKEEAL